jgi:hypothetical protein
LRIVFGKKWVGRVFHQLVRSPCSSDLNFECLANFFPLEGSVQDTCGHQTRAPSKNASSLRNKTGQKAVHTNQGCQIFLGTTYQNRGK